MLNDMENLFIKGHRIIEDPNLTEPKEILRTTKERLFSLPWRPWRKMKTIQIPKQEAFIMDIPLMGGKVIVMHPSYAEQLRKELEEKKN